MNRARELLFELKRRGVELRLIDGNLAAKPANSLDPDLRAQLKLVKGELIALLVGRTVEEPEAVLAEIRRCAMLVGTVVAYPSGTGLLIGVYRDRAAVDNGSVILTLNLSDVQELDKAGQKEICSTKQTEFSDGS